MCPSPHAWQGAKGTSSLGVSARSRDSCRHKCRYATDLDATGLGAWAMVKEPHLTRRQEKHRS